MDNIKFISNEEILSILKCSICYSVFNNPFRASCSHSFCEICIKNWLKNNKNCPICRKKINKKASGKDLIAEKIIMSIDVKCDKTGCPWEGKLEKFFIHLKNCSFEAVSNEIKNRFFKENQCSNSLKNRIYNKNKEKIEKIYRKTNENDDFYQNFNLLNSKRKRE